MKKELRILGIDDSSFSKKDQEVLIIGTIFRGGSYLDGLLSFYVKNDSNDATNLLISSVNKSKHKKQLRCIMLNGISVAGFNMLDIKEISKKTLLPVIVIMRKFPNLKKFKSALSRIDKTRLKAIKNAGKIYSLKINHSKIFFQISGISKSAAMQAIKLSTTRSNIPEPIRIAHIIASSITKPSSHS